jgi:hypothetical protein
VLRLTASSAGRTGQAGLDAQPFICTLLAVAPALPAGESQARSLVITTVCRAPARRTGLADANIAPAHIVESTICVPPATAWRNRQRLC